VSHTVHTGVLYLRCHIRAYGVAGVRERALQRTRAGSAADERAEQLAVQQAVGLAHEGETARADGDERAVHAASHARAGRAADASAHASAQRGRPCCGPSTGACMGRACERVQAVRFRTVKIPESRCGATGLASPSSGAVVVGLDSTAQAMTRLCIAACPITTE
jgi:hypothetical protein